MTNIKDLVTTICAWVTVVGGAVLAAQVAGQVTLPVSVSGIIGSVVAVALAISQFLTGKNANGTTKTPSQVASQTNAANTPPK